VQPKWTLIEARILSLLLSPNLVRQTEKERIEKSIIKWEWEVQKGTPTWAATLLAFLAAYSRCFVHPLTAFCWYFVGLFVGILWAFRRHFADSLSAFCWRFLSAFDRHFCQHGVSFLSHYFRLLALLENIILGWKWLKVTNTLAYYGTALIYVTNKFNETGSNRFFVHNFLFSYFKTVSDYLLVSAPKFWTMTNKNRTWQTFIRRKLNQKMSRYFIFLKDIAISSVFQKI